MPPRQPAPGADGTHFATCPLCEATCGIAVTLSDGRITAIRGDNADPFSRGHICPKAPALKELHEDPDRLRRPMLREGDTWREAAWDEALDVAARGLLRVQAEHGNDAVGIYLGNPNVHNLGAMLFGPMLVRALKTKNRFSATSVDQLPHMIVAYAMWGHQLLVPIPDIDHTKLWVIFGGNPLASNGSLMTVPDVKNRIKALQSRGGRLIVVDPRRSETAAVADRHLFVRPGTDAAVLAAIVHVLWRDGLVADSTALKLCDGAEALRAAVAPFTPYVAAAASGINVADIEQLAHDIAAAKSAAVYGRVGVSTQPFGAVCQWLIQTINILTGNFDRRGGVLFTKPAVDAVGGGGAFALGRGSMGRWRSRVRGVPEFGGELPVSTLGEEMQTPGPGQVRAMLTVAGNPVLSTPNGGALDRGFAGLDHYVAIDFYLNETTRHAHVILPPTGPLERDHYDLAFYLLSVRNFAKFAPAVMPLAADAKHDWQIHLALIERLAAGRGRGKTPLALRLRHAALRCLGPRGMVALALRAGPYGDWKPLGRGLTLQRLLAAPHGIDLGPLQPSLPGRLPKKRIDLAPGMLVDDLRRAADELRPDTTAEGRTLALIGRRHVRSNNSWLHNVPGLMSGRERCTLLLHPDDAERLQLRDGAFAKVASRVGAVTVPVQISDQVMPGVVSLPHGFGHQRPGVRARVATAHPGVSINDLSDDTRVDAVGGNAAFSGTPVTVTPV